MSKLRTGEERMAVIETDIKYIKNDTAEIKSTVKTFIESANKTYATKEELCAVRDSVKDTKLSSKEWVRWAIPVVLTFLNLIIVYTIYVGK